MPKSRILSVIYHHPGNRTEVIEDFLDTKALIIRNNGSMEKLTVASSEENLKFIDSITEDDVIEWSEKNGMHSSLELQMFLEGYEK